MTNPINNNPIPFAVSGPERSLSRSTSSATPLVDVLQGNPHSSQTVAGSKKSSISNYFFPKNVNQEEDIKCSINNRDKVGPRPSLLSPSSLSFSTVECDELGYQCYIDQFRLNQEGNRIDQSLVIKDASVNDGLMRQFLNLQEEAQKRSKISKIFSWMSLSTAAMATAFLVGTLAATTLGAGGVTVAAVLTAATGVASFYGGKQKIISSVFAFLGNKSMGDAQVFKDQGRLLKESITTRQEQMQENESSNPDLCAELAQLIKSQPRVTSF